MSNERVDFILPIGDVLETSVDNVEPSVDYGDYEPVQEQAAYDQMWGSDDDEFGGNYDDDYDTSGLRNRDLRRQHSMSGPRGSGRKRHNSQGGDFLERVEEILGVDTDTAKGLFSAKRIKAVRTNRFGYDPEMTDEERSRSLADELGMAGVDVTELRWFGGSLLFDASEMEKVASSSAVEEGRAFIQSPTSYMPVFALDAHPGETIVDMCAAPGGKTALIADRLSGDPELLYANELKARRLERMRDVLATLMLDSTVTVGNHDAKHLPQHLGASIIERVLADVECSTEAGINFESRDALKGWSRNRVERVARLQKQIIRSGFDLLQPGGTLIYSTCSLAPEENEAVLAELLERREDAIVQPVSLTIEERVRPIRQWAGQRYADEVSQGVLRIQPNEYLEPFTVVRIRKATGDPELDEMMRQAVDLDELVRQHK